MAVIVGVLGCGTMGAGIAQVAAQAGHAVVLYDVDASRAAAAVEGIAAQLDRLVAKGRLASDEAAAVRERLSVANELTDLAEAGLIVEAILESLDAKREIFGRLEDIVADDCVLATNTSSISVTAIAATLKHPGRCVGMHFFNPAPLMKLVEVVSGLATDPAVATQVADLAEAWGKVPVQVSSTPGFIVNRVARPFYGEAMRALEERAADAATIDAALRDCGGFKMGPLELTDLIGHDVNYAVTTSVWKAFFNDPRYTPSLVQGALVDAGRFGRKSGHGFYDYTEGAPAPKPATASRVEIWPSSSRVHGNPDVLGGLLDRLRQAGVDLFIESGAKVNAGALELTDGALLMTSDGRTATARSRELGAPVVSLDLALDYGSAPRFIIAPSNGCPAVVMEDALGLLQAAGADVTVIDDVAGMLVLRTVAMLVNEAVDVVGRGVADAAAVDNAMRYGAGYPVGPIAWGGRLGASRVVEVLDHLEDHYRDGRYRACPLLRRLAAAGEWLSA